MALRDTDPIPADGLDSLDKELDELMAAAQGESILAQEPRVVRDPTPGPKRPKAESRRRARRRTTRVSLRLAVLLVSLAVAGTAYALTQTTLPAEQIELFDTATSVTDFSVATFDSTPSGDNDLTIDITLDNTDAGSAHFANVTVNILNSTGDEIANQTLATGSVAASGSVSLTFTYAQANIVPNYDSAQVVVKQSS